LKASMGDLTKKRILIVEDEPHLAEGLKLNLSLKGYDVMIAEDGISGLEKWKAWQPDLIVLDIMLPGIDGWSLLQSVRLADERIPVLILSAKVDSNDKVKGFSYGADDYLAKPFNLEEFLLRVERLLTRMSWHQGETDANGLGVSSLPRTYRFGDNIINFETLTAKGPAGQIDLTEQEVKLLKLFVTHRGEPLSRSKLLQIGWGYAKGTTTRTVDNFIVRFRKYFENKPHKPIYFKSIRSVGYVFDHDSDEETAP
jgi:two-component system alkaline phosphatase synthesis response regulator PhoP